MAASACLSRPERIAIETTTRMTPKTGFALVETAISRSRFDRNAARAPYATARRGRLAAREKTSIRKKPRNIVEVWAARPTKSPA